jgi:hypothetical protein
MRASLVVGPVGTHKPGQLTHGLVESFIARHPIYDVRGPGGRGRQKLRQVPVRVFPHTRGERRAKMRRELRAIRKKAS